MGVRCGQSGFTLMEVLAALATILVLMGALLGVGSYVKTRASADLTQSMLDVLCTGLLQYYNDLGDFPFDTDTNGDNVLDASDVYTVSILEAEIGGTVTGSLLDEDASSAALFYFLDRNPSSRSIVNGIDNSLVTNKDGSGTDITFTFTAGGNTIDLPRYIDPWKMSIRYEYLPGTAFPVLTSAGPDKIFDTPDDITSK